MYMQGGKNKAEGKKVPKALQKDFSTEKKNCLSAVETGQLWREGQEERALFI